MAIYITLEGGLVQNVSSDDPAMVGKEFVVIDYDVEGASDDEITQVDQDNGDVCEAIVWKGKIDQLTVGFDEKVPR